MTLSTKSLTLNIYYFITPQTFTISEESIKQIQDYCNNLDNNIIISVRYYCLLITGVNNYKEISLQDKFIIEDAKPYISSCFNIISKYPYTGFSSPKKSLNLMLTVLNYLSTNRKIKQSDFTSFIHNKLSSILSSRSPDFHRVTITTIIRINCNNINKDTLAISLPLDSNTIYLTHTRNQLIDIILSKASKYKNSKRNSNKLSSNINTKKS